MRRPVFVEDLNHFTEKLLGVTPDTPTGDRAYRMVVRPLGCFLACGGLFLAVVSTWGTLTGPLIHSEETTRFLLRCTSLFLVIAGLGMIGRSRAAWYGFLAYWLIGTPLVNGFIICQQVQRSEADVPALFLLAIWAAVLEAAGVFVMIEGRPAFREPLGSIEPSNDDS